MRFLALVTLLGVATQLAHAADVPVRYLVNDTQLKTAVTWTNLTFTLYTDSACATPAIATSVIPVENVNVISRLNLREIVAAPTGRLSLGERHDDGPGPGLATLHTPSMPRVKWSASTRLARASMDFS
jgi:hypothetical protein